MSRKFAVEFNGSGSEYLVMSLGLGLLAIVTLGIAFPYVAYRQVRYFLTHIVLVEQ